jgi:hypothetical protein
MERVSTSCRGVRLLAVAAVVLVGCTTGSASPPRSREPGWQPLWNGVDLDGWQPDRPGVFSVVNEDGEPVLRVAGELPGMLASARELADYHLRVEFKWGRRSSHRHHRDGGLLYHTRLERTDGPPHVRGFELQIYRRQLGDLFGLHEAAAEVRGRREDPTNGLGAIVFAPEGETVTIGPGSPLGRRVVRAEDAERPVGEWNVLELLCVRRTSVHVVNGRTVMVALNLRQRVNGREVPLTSGSIQLNAEGSEMFFRNLEVRPLQEIPSTLFD